MRDLVFLDVETTGLDPEVHEMFEVGLTKTDVKGEILGSLYYWIVPQHLQTASPQALALNGYYRRKMTEPCEGRVHGAVRQEVAEEIVIFTEGVHLVGCNPGFDASFVRAFLLAEQHVPLWHHRMIDLESLAIGIEPDVSHGVPMGLSELAETFNKSEIPEEDRHTAKGDVEATRVLYFKMMEMARG